MIETLACGFSSDAFLLFSGVVLGGPLALAIGIRVLTNILMTRAADRPS